MFRSFLVFTNVKRFIHTHQKKKKKTNHTKSRKCQTAINNSKRDTYIYILNIKPVRQENANSISNCSSFVFNLSTMESILTKTLQQL